MSRFIQRTVRIGSAILALGCGVMVGTTLAVVAMEGRFSALTDLVWRAAWIMRGRPMAPDEADGMWMLELEWSIALRSALLIAPIGSIVWAVVTWRSRQSYRAAALIGFVLASAGAWLLSNRGEAVELMLFCSLVGFCGAIAGVVTRAVDQTIMRIGFKTGE
jgi:hypothetical protein